MSSKTVRARLRPSVADTFPHRSKCTISSSKPIN